MTSALITRLAKLDGPDREVDWLIADHFTEIPKHTIREIGWDYDWWRGPNEYSLKKAIDSEGRRIDTWSPNAYTASVDAAIALAERVLPGWKRSFFENFNGKWIARVCSPRRDLYSTDYLRDTELGGSPNGSIALCIAILHAKEASK